MPKNPSLLVVAVLALPASALAQTHAPIPGLKATMRPVSHHMPVGHPVLVEFTIANTGDDPITLTVPGTEPEIPSAESGLPLAHVFSGGSSSGLTITTPTDRMWDEPVGYRKPQRAPILMIAPHSSVGTTVDVREFYPMLRGAGRYRMTWKPYGGGVSADPVVVNIAPMKRAEIVTDSGTMTLRFFYADAPNHVANFLELAKSGFYTGKTFHRLEPGYLLQGGCPRGDGTGIRLDGKRIPPEFNGRTMEKGTVAMALLDDDPESASCQFFICNTRYKDWDGRYTVFARLVGEASYETLDRLMETRVDDFGRPVTPLVMRTLRLIDAPPNETP